MSINLKQECLEEQKRSNKSFILIIRFLHNVTSNTPTILKNCLAFVVLCFSVKVLYKIKLNKI